MPFLINNSSIGEKRLVNRKPGFLPSKEKRPPTNFYHFLRIWIIAFFVSVGLFGPVVGALFGTLLSVVAFAFITGFSNMAGSLYHRGSNVKDHKAVIKGMYNLASGYENTSEFVKAEKTYKQILKDYPEELDAIYHLGRLYDKRFDDPERAYNVYRKLKKKISGNNSDYKYKESLDEKISELKEYLGK